MPAITPFKLSVLPLQSPSTTKSFFPNTPSTLTKFNSPPNFAFSFSSPKKTLFQLKSSEEESAEFSDEWLQKLPEKNKPLYSHSLPCLEAWLKKLRFYQSRDDRAVWFVENPDWHAQVSLDVTDLYIRYLKNGPGNLEKDVERRFSYSLSREDIENAILGGP